MQRAVLWAYPCPAVFTPHSVYLEHRTLRSQGEKGALSSFEAALKIWLLIMRRLHFQSLPAPSPERREGSPGTFLRLAVLIPRRAPLIST